MGSDDLTDYGQAKACPFFVFAAGEVGLVEAVPDELLVILGNTDAAVPDRDEDCVALLSGLYGDIGILAAEFEGVVDEVVEDLLDLLQVRIDKEHLSCEDEPDVDPAGAAGLFKRGGNGAYDSIDVKIRALQEHASGIEIVECKKSVGQLGEAVGLFENDPQIVFVALGRDGSIQHCLEEAPSSDRAMVSAIYPKEADR